MRFIAVLLTALLAACASGGRAATPAHTALPSAYENGRSIFMTGRDLDGRRITASPPPLRSSCVQCHRPNGSGGVHLPGGVVSADLRHAALVTGQKHPYTIPLLERAISTGVDNEGQNLNPVMPRWKMSRRDLHDVAAYVYRLK